MSVDPLAIAPSPEQVPAPQPGLFDGMAQPNPAEIPAPPVMDIPLMDAEQAPVPEETEVAGIGSVLKGLLKSKVVVKGMDSVLDEGASSGVLGNYTIIREATEEEVAEFGTLTGKTSGAPSPTSTQREAGIPTAEFNLENITGPDELKATIDNVAEMWKEQGQAAGRGTMTFEEIKSLANDMGLEDTVERLLRRDQGSAMNAEHITASLQAVATSGMELNRLAKIAANSTDSADLLRFRQHLGFHSAIQIQMKGAQAEAGRALAAFRIPRGVGPDVDAEALAGMMQEFGGENSVRDMAKSFLALPTQAQRNKFSYGGWDKVKGTWFEVWINGLLSGPGTHVINMNGNTIFQLTQIPERFGAGLIGLAKRAMGSKADRVYIGETTADIMGTVQGIGDGFRLAGQAWKTEAPVRDIVGKVEAGQRRMITGENLAPNGSEYLRKGIDYLGATIRLPGRALMTEDEFFKAVAYRREINSLAYRKSMRMSEAGASQDEIAMAMDDIFSGADKEIATQAEEFAQYATFTNPIDGTLATIGAGIQSTVVGRFLLPFFKTPMNILKAGVERSPFGFVNAIREASGPQKDILLSRAALGTSVMAYAGAQYMDGGITGSGPSNYALRQQMESIGWQRWSLVSPKEGVENPRWLKIGHTAILHPDDVDYVSYHKLEPVSMILAVAADVTERFRWPTATQDSIDEIGMSALNTVFDYMKEQTVLSGMSNIAELISLRSGQARSDGMAKAVQQLVGSQVPYSSLLANIERIMDPSLHSVMTDRNEPVGLRDLYAGLSKMDERMPLTESDGPMLLDRFGNPRVSENSTILKSILPPFVTDIMGDDIDAIEAGPTMVEVLAAGVPLTMPKRKIDGVPLNAEEYHTLVTLSAQPPGVDSRGNPYMSFHEALTMLVTMPSFKTALIPDRQVLIKGLDAEYKSIAQLLILESPEYAEEFADLREEVAQHREIIDANGRQIQ